VFLVAFPTGFESVPDVVQLRGGRCAQSGATKWAIGPGWWEDDLLEAYGDERDSGRIDYYRRLWEAPDQSGG
jgi:hypothetical protein